MRQFLKTILPLLAVFLSSCAIKMIPVTGTYPDQPIQIKSEKPFDDVWSNLIDVFAQKGLSIKIIDKNSGLIVSERIEFPATIEDKNGNLKDPNAYIVVPKYRSKMDGKFYPINSFRDDYLGVNGEWNVRVKKRMAKVLL